MLGREATDRDEPVAAADIVCCCTTAREQLFDGALVADHATPVGSILQEHGHVLEDAVVAASLTNAQLPDERSDAASGGFPDQYRR